MKIVTISDTHTYEQSVVVPDGDILIHSGDATFRGYEHEVRAFGEWFRAQPHRWKIFVAGNHDTSFEDQPTQALEWFYGDKGNSLNRASSDTIYLLDESITLDVDGESVSIYGAPWQPWFYDWAFNIKRAEDLKAVWDKIPKGTDILVTHGPAYKLADTNQEGEHCGCRELRKAIQRVKPKLHVCGHIHEGYGVSKWGDTIVANSSICTRRYKPTNEPLIFEFKDGKMRETPKV